MTEAQLYVQDCLKTLITLFHLTGPKYETVDESRFILSNGCCYQVRQALSVALLKKGYSAVWNDHGWHAWIEVDGKAFDSLQPLGYSTSVSEYWLVGEMFPNTDVEHDGSGHVVDWDKVALSPYARLTVALKAFVRYYGLAVEPQRRKANRYKLRRFQRRLEKRQKAGIDVVVTTYPISSPNAYFTDSIEPVDNGRVLLPYPYRLSHRFWMSRVKDLKKRNLPIWQR